MSLKYIYYTALALTVLGQLACSQSSSSGGGDNKHTPLFYTAQQIDDGKLRDDLSIYEERCSRVARDKTYEKLSQIDWAQLKDRGFNLIIVCDHFVDATVHSNGGELISSDVAVTINIEAEARSIQNFLNSQISKPEIEALLAETIGLPAEDDKIAALQESIEAKSGRELFVLYDFGSAEEELLFLQKLDLVDWDLLRNQTFKEILVKNYAVRDSKSILDVAKMNTEYNPYIKKPYVGIDPSLSASEIFHHLESQETSASPKAQWASRIHNAQHELYKKDIDSSCDKKNETCAQALEALNNSDSIVLKGRSIRIETNAKATKTGCEIIPHTEAFFCELSSQAKLSDIEAAIQNAIETVQNN